MGEFKQNLLDVTRRGMTEEGDDGIVEYLH